MVVYDQLSQPLSDAARQALAGMAPVILPLFSPRSARILSEQVTQARAPLWLVPISPAAAARWQAGQARMLVAGAESWGHSAYHPGRFPNAHGPCNFPCDAWVEALRRAV